MIETHELRLKIILTIYIACETQEHGESLPF